MDGSTFYSVTKLPQTTLVQELYTQLYGLHKGSAIAAVQKLAARCTVGARRMDDAAGSSAAPSMAADNSSDDVSRFLLRLALIRERIDASYMHVVDLPVVSSSSEDDREWRICAEHPRDAKNRSRLAWRGRSNLAPIEWS